MQHETPAINMSMPNGGSDNNNISAEAERSIDERLRVLEDGINPASSSRITIQRILSDSLRQAYGDIGRTASATLNNIREHAKRLAEAYSLPTDSREYLFSFFADSAELMNDFYIASTTTPNYAGMLNLIARNRGERESLRQQGSAGNVPPELTDLICKAMDEFDEMVVQCMEELSECVPPE